MKLKQMFL